MAEVLQPSEVRKPRIKNCALETPEVIFSEFYNNIVTCRGYQRKESLYIHNLEEMPARPELSLNEDLKEGFCPHTQCKFFKKVS